MRQKIKKNYTRALVIVHGKSELYICRHIKSNLRLKMEIDSEKNGENSIQITGLMTRLNNTVYKSLNTFLNKYDDIETEGKGKNRRLLNFKIFIIMDVDDCTPQQKEDYMTKKMFLGHWAYEYITPVWNIEKLEDVMQDCKIKIEDKGQYKLIFPINRTIKDSEQVKELAEKLKVSKKTNMNDFFEYCLNWP